MAANADTYYPPEFSDDAFNRWACRIALKMVNLLPRGPEHAMHRAIVSEGVPSPEWAGALLFMMEQARFNKRKATIT